MQGVGRPPGEGNGIMQSIAGRLMALVLIAFGMTAIGCGGTAYRKFNVNVGLDPAYPAGTPVTVDIVALGGERAADLEAMPMRKYWTLNDPYRQGLIAEGVLWTAELSSANPTATLSSRDAIWNTPTWKSGGKLFVLSEIRGVGPGPNGDPRRRGILRDSKLWTQSTIDVTVKPSGMSYSPTEKAVGR